MPVIAEFAKLLAGFSQPLILDDKAQLSILVTDTVGALVAGVNSHEGEQIIRFAGPHIMRGTAGRSMNPVLTRVAGHSAATRLTEFDSIHLPSGTTPAAIIIPTALALSLHVEDAKSIRFAGAVLAGLEAMTRFGAAVNGQSIVYKGIWTTYLAAPIGTAVTTAHMLGLDEDATSNAIAIALTSMAGRISQPGGNKTARWLMVGQAARAGGFAAFAAADGFTGDVSLLDGEWMSNAHGIAFSAGQLLAPRGSGSTVSQISLKPYSSAKQIVAATSGFEQLLARGIDPREIDSVAVHVPEAYRKMIDRGVVKGDRLSTATSAPYQLALSALAPEGLFDIERIELVETPDFLALMKKITIETDADLVQHLPNRWPARVSVTAKGRVEEITVIEAPGDPGNPFTKEQVGDKFRKFVSGAGLTSEQVEAWLAAAQNAVASDDAFKDLQALYEDIGAFNRQT